MDIEKIQPNMVEGLGFCSDDACPSYDGKRCNLTGFRPHGLCEPWAKGILAEVERLRGENERLRATVKRWEDEEASAGHKCSLVEQALRNVIESCATDSDTCAVCSNDLTRHVEGCAVFAADQLIGPEQFLDVDRG